MNKKMIYILNGIVAALCLCSCSGEDLNETKATKEPEPATQISEFVRTADDIPIEMLRADYWINMQKNPDKIVITEKEIFQWNEKFHKPFWNDLSENIGYGYIGFENILNVVYHPKLNGIPKIFSSFHQSQTQIILFLFKIFINKSSPLLF